MVRSSRLELVIDQPSSGKTVWDAMSDVGCLGTAGRSHVDDGVPITATIRNGAVGWFPNLGVPVLATGIMS
jgi:hypothetical protein